MTFDDQLVRFILALAVLVAGNIFLIFLSAFGKRLSEFSFEQEFRAEIYDLLRQFGPPTAWPSAWLDRLTSSHDQDRDRRKDVWELFGQVELAILIVVVLAVLLLTKVISAEAGLPILSAVAGFAIAKSGGIQVTHRRPAPPQGRDEARDVKRD